MPRKASTDVDPRYTPFIQHAYDTYRERNKVTLIIDASDGKQLQQMLVKTQNLPEYDLEHLKCAWHQMLNSRDRYDREAGKPIRHFCVNVTKFAALACKSGVRPAPTGEKTTSANTNTARAWVQKKLGL